VSVLKQMMSYYVQGSSVDIKLEATAERRTLSMIACHWQLVSKLATLAPWRRYTFTEL